MIVKLSDDISIDPMEGQFVVIRTAPPGKEGHAILLNPAEVEKMLPYMDRWLPNAKHFFGLDKVT